MCLGSHHGLVKLTSESCSSSDLQEICGFSCDDLSSMFKELKGLGMVVKQLSNDLRQVVRIKTSCLSDVHTYMCLSFHPVSLLMPNTCSSANSLKVVSKWQFLCSSSGFQTADNSLIMTQIKIHEGVCLHNGIVHRDKDEWTVDSCTHCTCQVWVFLLM